MATIEESIRRAVRAYLESSELNERKLSAFAVGDPALIPRLMAGGSMRLHTADALLSYIEEPPIGPKFISEVEAFLSETTIEQHKFGSMAAGDASFVTKLRSGALRLSTIERVRTWMRVNKRVLIVQSQSNRGETSPATSSDAAKYDTPAATPDSRPDDAPPRQRTTPVRQDLKIFLSTREAAELLTLSSRTLDRYRVHGGGPAFVRLGGRVRYTRADLLEWALARREEGTPARN